MKIIQNIKKHCNPAIFILVIIAACLTLLNIGEKSYWLDETYSVSFVNGSWADLWQIVSTREANMSIYYVMLKVWVWVFGDGEKATRTLSAIMGIGAVLMTYRIGCRLFSRQVGLASGLLLASNAFFLQYAQETRGYTLTLLLVAVAFYLFIDAVENQRNRGFVALGIANALVLYSHFVGFFAIIAQALSLLFLPPGRIRWKKVIFCGSVTGFLSLPLALFIGTQEGPPFGWIPRASLGMIYSAFADFTGGGGKVPVFLFFIACSMGLVGVWRDMKLSLKSGTVWKYSIVFNWLILPIALLAILSFVKPFFVSRYLFFCLPALMLCATVGLSSYGKKWFFGTGTVLLVVVSLLAAFLVYFPKERSDWRSAARYIAEKTESKDGIMFYAWVGQIPFQYYYKKFHMEREDLGWSYPFPIGTPVASMISRDVHNPNDKTIEEMAEACRRLWLVRWGDTIPGLGWDIAAVRRLIRGEYVERDGVAFTHIGVDLYERKKEGVDMAKVEKCLESRKSR